MSTGEQGAADNTRINVADIETTLNRLWDALHSEEAPEQGITRACMSNLIIACETDQQAQQVRERIPTLVEHHPARVFLLTAVPPAQGAIDAEVSAHCRRVEGEQQLCSEHVDIHFDPQVVDRLGSVLRPLLVGDLPTALWWASNRPPPLAGALFDVLAELADQVIYTSVGWPNPAEGVSAMTRWVVGNPRPVFNLAWRHLKPWRRILAQVLAPQVAPGALEHIQRIRIDHGPHALPMAWLLIGWLAARLDWQPQQGKLRSATQADWSFQSPSGNIQVEIHRLDVGPAQPRRLELAWQGPTPGTVTFVLDDDEWLHVDPATSTLPHAALPSREPPLETMIAAQLAHRSRDTLFQQAMGVAQVMAGVLN